MAKPGWFPADHVVLIDNSGKCILKLGQVTSSFSGDHVVLINTFVQVNFELGTSRLLGNDYAFIEIQEY